MHLDTYLWPLVNVTVHRNEHELFVFPYNAYARMSIYFHFNSKRHIGAYSLQPNSLFLMFSRAWSAPIRSRVLCSHVAEHRTARLLLDEDNSSACAPSDTRPPHSQDAQGEGSSVKDLTTKWGGFLQGIWRPGLGGGWGVGSLISYSAKTFFIPALITHQSQRGFHHASLTKVGNDG